MEPLPTIRPFPKLNLLPVAGKTTRAEARRAFPVRNVIFVLVAALSWFVAIVSVGVLMSWIKLPAWV